MRKIFRLKAISQNLMHSNLSITDGIYGILSEQDVGIKISDLGKINGDDRITNKVLI